MKMTTRNSGDLRSVETCTNTCLMYPALLTQGTEKNLTGISFPTSDSSGQSYKHKPELFHSITCRVYKLNKFPHSYQPTKTCNNTSSTAAESDYKVTLTWIY
jgi:hypothetical protein